MFESYDDIVDRSCAAWRFFAGDPERVVSITSRAWATVNVEAAIAGGQPQEHGNREVRKAIDRQYLAGASWQGQMIKCADMLSNTKDIVADDLRFARVYVPEKRLLIDELTKVRYPI